MHSLVHSEIAVFPKAKVATMSNHLDVARY